MLTKISFTDLLTPIVITWINSIRKEMHTTTESDLLIKFNENSDCWVGMDQRKKQDVLN